MGDPLQDFLSSIPPEKLAQIMGSGTLDQTDAMLQRQIAQAHASRQARMQNQSYGAGAGMAAGLSGIIGGVKEGILQNREQDALKQRQAGLEAFAGAAQGGNTRGAALLALLSGNKQLEGVGQNLQAQQGIDLANQKTQQEIANAGPQQALGDQSPSTYEKLTKRMEVGKPTVVPPGSGVVDRNGRSLAGPAGGNDIIAQTGDGIISGLAPPDMKGLGRLRVPVQAYLAKKGFNLSQANLDWQATQKHLATLNSGSQERLNQAINFVSDTIPVIRQLYGEWQKEVGASGFKIANKAALAAMKQLPGNAGATAQALETQINDFASELGTVYKGGGTSTDKSLGMAASNLAADWNPETFNKALDLAERNIAIRKNSVTHSMVRGASAANPYAQPAPTQTAPTKPTAPAPASPDVAAELRKKYGL